MPECWECHSTCTAEGCAAILKCEDGHTFNICSEPCLTKFFNTCDSVPGNIQAAWTKWENKRMVAKSNGARRNQVCSKESKGVLNREGKEQIRHMEEAKRFGVRLCPYNTKDGQRLTEECSCPVSQVGNTKRPTEGCADEVSTDDEGDYDEHGEPEAASRQISDSESAKDQEPDLAPPPVLGSESLVPITKEEDESEEWPIAGKTKKKPTKKKAKVVEVVNMEERVEPSRTSRDVPLASQTTPTTLARAKRGVPPAVAVVPKVRAVEAKEWPQLPSRQVVVASAAASAAAGAGAGAGTSTLDRPSIPASLPAGWTQHWDSIHEAYFYWDGAAETTQWETPSHDAAEANKVQQRADELRATQERAERVEQQRAQQHRAEQQRRAEEQREAEEQQRRLAEEQQRAEEEQRAEEQRRRLAEEQRRVEEEQVRAEEQQRLQSLAQQLQQAEGALLAQEEAYKLAQDRVQMLKQELQSAQRSAQAQPEQPEQPAQQEQQEQQGASPPREGVDYICCRQTRHKWDDESNRNEIRLLEGERVSVIPTSKPGWLYCRSWTDKDDEGPAYGMVRSKFLERASAPPFGQMNTGEDHTVMKPFECPTDEGGYLTVSPGDKVVVQDVSEAPAIWVFASRQNDGEVGWLPTCVLESRY